MGLKTSCFYEFSPFRLEPAEDETYARGNDITIVRTFHEKAIPGATELDNRPVLVELLESLAADGVKVVLIEKLNRLARGLLVQATIIGDMQKRGFELISAPEPICLLMIRAAN